MTRMWRNSVMVITNIKAISRRKYPKKGKKNSMFVSWENQDPQNVYYYQSNLGSIRSNQNTDGALPISRKINAKMYRNTDPKAHLFSVTITRNFHCSSKYDYNLYFSPL